jgi:hypothetical protein
MTKAAAYEPAVSATGYAVVLYQAQEFAVYFASATTGATIRETTTATKTRN